MPKLPARLEPKPLEPTVKFRGLRILIAVFVLIVLTFCALQIRTHPHQLGSIVGFDPEGKSEEDFDRAFGSTGIVIAGERKVGFPYKTEWVDDTSWVQVTFGRDGKWKGIAKGPFFSGTQSTIPSAFDRFKLALRKLGFDVR